MNWRNWFQSIYPFIRKWGVTLLLITIIYYVGSGIIAYLTAPRIEMTMSPIAGRVAVAVKPAEKGEIASSVTYTGTVRPFLEVTIFPRTEGWLQDIKVDVGDPIRKGELVARLDKREIQTKLAERQAHRVFREQEFERDRRLFEAGAISQTEFDRSRMMLDEAKAMEENARTLLSYTDILSPIDGIVTDRIKLINPGELVSPGTPLLKIADTRRMRIQVKVAEKDIPFIKKGTEALARFPHLTNPHDRTPVEVTTIFPSLDPTTRTALVELVLDNRAGMIRADMFAVVDLVLQRKTDAVIIPRHAVLEIVGKPSIFVTDGVVAMQRGVVLGNASGDRIEIMDGLKEGEMVIYKGQSGLTELQEVNIVEGL